VTRASESAWERDATWTRSDSREAVRAWSGDDDRRLHPFGPLIRELATHLGPMAELRGRRVIELGPGRRTALAERLTAELGERFTCVGLPRFCTTLRSYRFEDVNTWLARAPAHTADVVVSRYVLETNSYHPLALLRSRAFWGLVRRGPREEVWREIPGSPAYLRRTLRELGRVVARGGLVIAMVVDRRRTDSLLEDAPKERFEVLARKALDGRRGIFTLRGD